MPNFRCKNNSIKDCVNRGNLNPELEKETISLKHATTIFAQTIEETRKILGGTFLEHAIKIENNLYQSHKCDIENNKILLLTDSLQYMLLRDNCEITDEIIKDNISWPEYSENDVNITKWFGGQHYYAKIGKMDVVDENGDQKWDSLERAMEAAQNFLKKL